MKKLIFINGPMGVGKTTVCQHLYKQLPDSVWLDDASVAQVAGLIASEIFA